MNLLIEEIQALSLPFADSWEHIQGPGGNTSVKTGHEMIIKASGYTFQNVTKGTGLVVVDNMRIRKDLANNYDDGAMECQPPLVLESVPDGLRPSMEFEFHAVLGKYVLHTHSVYVNLITCAKECEILLNEIFFDIPFVLVPYLIPGHPLASYIYQQVHKGTNANIFFLKNHGVIVHAETKEETIGIYNMIQGRIIAFFKLGKIEDNVAEANKVTFSDICAGLLSVTAASVCEDILVPDQSIFFKNKVSAEYPEKDIVIDNENRIFKIKGSPKFHDAAIAMLRMIFFILNTQKKTGITPEYIPVEEVNKLHGLSSEKYRVTIL